jgi:transcriptional regulator with XRE-family HTH domain
MIQPLPTYLRSHRRKWAFTQRELAGLIGCVSADAISKYEALERTPRTEVAMALEIIFEETPKELFPVLSHAVHCEVLRNAKLLQKKLAEMTDAKSARKRQFLEALITRSHNTYGKRA